MLIRLTTGLSGSEFNLGPGDERDFPSDEAVRLIAAGFAVPVAEEKIERAVVAPAPERRAKKVKRDVVSSDSNG